MYLFVLLIPLSSFSEFHATHILILFIYMFISIYLPPALLRSLIIPIEKLNTRNPKSKKLKKARAIKENCGRLKVLGTLRNVK